MLWAGNLISNFMAKKSKKSKACSKVLQLMDSEEGYSYGKALKKVLSEDKRLSKTKLEKELNAYI